MHQNHGNTSSSSMALTLVYQSASFEEKKNIWNEKLMWETRDVKIVVLGVLSSTQAWAYSSESGWLNGLILNRPSYITAE